MHIRRCALLLIEPRELVAFSMDSLLSGGDGLSSSERLLALAPHRGEPVDVTTAEIAVLAAIPAGRWIPMAGVLECHTTEIVQKLLDAGLLLSDSDDPHGWRARDDQLQGMHWWAPAAISHYYSKWDNVSAVEGSREPGFRSMAELAHTLGAPPSHVIERARADQRMALPRLPRTDFDDLLDRRTTCRNFDQQRALSLDLLAQLMERTFAARGQVQVREDTVVIKRSSPSGGGLHPIDCYVLVQNVADLASGIYHYHPVAHALEPLRLVDGAALRSMACSALAGQDYWAEAHVQVVMVARFPRHFWKYRNHSKAYRVVVLDAGHLSQTLYLAATEAGLGAFVTGAINETGIEALLQLDPLEDGVLAVCGFGLRAAQRISPEFDPNGRVWPILASSPDALSHAAT
ncbi:MAG: putative peptide maturation dehydrogenase [Tahibacter sp.]